MTFEVSSASRGDKCREEKIHKCTYQQYNPASYITRKNSELENNQQLEIYIVRLILYRYKHNYFMVNYNHTHKTERLS